MIESETLRFLDYLTWLGDTESVAERCVCDLSTVNRYLGKCCKTFNISRHKTGGEWSLTGDVDLLREERRLHQYHRWHHDKRIRVDGYFYHHPLYLSTCPEGIELGSFELLDASIIRDLVADSVVDVFMVNGPNMAQLNAELTCIPVSKEPLELYAFQGHPLLEKTGRDRSLDVATHYPLIAYGKTILPHYYEAFGVLFSRRIPAFDTTRFCLDRVLTNLSGVQDPLVPGAGTLQWAGGRLKHPSLERLGIDLPIAYGDALLVRSEYVKHPLMIRLIETVRQRVQELQRELPRLECSLSKPRVDKS